VKVDDFMVSLPKGLHEKIHEGATGALGIKHGVHGWRPIQELRLWMYINRSA
jgi:hypothetical protein